MTAFPGKVFTEGQQPLQHGVFLSMSPTGCAEVAQIWTLPADARFHSVPQAEFGAALDELLGGRGIFVTSPEPDVVDEFRRAFLAALDAVSGPRDKMGRA